MVATGKSLAGKVCRCIFLGDCYGLQAFSGEGATGQVRSSGKRCRVGRVLNHTTGMEEEADIDGQGHETKDDDSDAHEPGSNLPVFFFKNSPQEDQLQSPSSNVPSVQ